MLLSILGGEAGDKYHLSGDFRNFTVMPDRAMIKLSYNIMQKIARLALSTAWLFCGHMI